MNEIIYLNKEKIQTMINVHFGLRNFLGKFNSLSTAFFFKIKFLKLGGGVGFINRMPMSTAFHLFVHRKEKKMMLKLLVTGLVNV